MRGQTSGEGWCASNYRPHGISSDASRRLEGERRPWRGGKGGRSMKAIRNLAIIVLLLGLCAGGIFADLGFGWARASEGPGCGLGTIISFHLPSGYGVTWADGAL